MGSVRGGSRATVRNSWSFCKRGPEMGIAPMVKRAGGLYGRIAERENLRLAFWKATRGRRVRTAARTFAQNLDRNLERLADELRDGDVQVGDYHQFTIHDPKERLITAPCFRDRVLHHAIMNVCEPVLERTLIHDTYACRRGKGRIAALRRAQCFASRATYHLVCDIRKYFDSISHPILLEALRRRFKEPRLLGLFAKIIGGYRVRPGFGLPIGSLTSQHFANHYLAEFDHRMVREPGVLGYVRYMDDFVVWSEDRVVLNRLRESIREDLATTRRLELKHEPSPNRSALGLDYLGCRIYKTHATLSRRSRVRFQRRFRLLERLASEEQITEANLQTRATAMFAFARTPGLSTWRWRRNVITGFAA